MSRNLFSRSVLTALLAGTLAVGAMATVANAAVDTRLRVSFGTSQFDFQKTPNWVAVPGTRVYMVRDDMRPTMDFFRFGNRYYVYDHGTWYRSTRWNGRYVMVHERNLPAQFHKVPRTHWRDYPGNWDERRDWKSNRQDERPMNHRSGSR
jgi:hypothetical protein